MAKKDSISPKTIKLALLKKTVEALEKALEEADGLKGGDTCEYILAMDRAIGYASGITSESTLIIGDLSYLVNAATLGETSTVGKIDIDKILGGYKPGFN
jgi:hypothetical protein